MLWVPIWIALTDRFVDTIQMSTHNICFDKENQKEKTNIM